MSAVLKHTAIKVGALLAAVSLCVVSTGVSATDSGGTALVFAGGAIGLTGDGTPQVSGESQQNPMILKPAEGLDFDLAGSETCKLQLVLDQPLSLQAGMETRLH